jgi:hypothetical protein
MKTVSTEELLRTIEIQQSLIDLLNNQMVDLSMMSKIELGDDVIAEIKRLKLELKRNSLAELFEEFQEVGAPSMYEITKLKYKGQQQ